MSRGKGHAELYHDIRTALGDRYDPDRPLAEIVAKLVEREVELAKEARALRLANKDGMPVRLTLEEMLAAIELIKWARGIGPSLVRNQVIDRFWRKLDEAHLAAIAADHE